MWRMRHPDQISRRREARAHCPQHTVVVVQVAPGIDIEKDIFAHMEFRPLVSPSLKTMDPSLFQVKTADGVHGVSKAVQLGLIDPLCRCRTTTTRIADNIIP